MNFNIYKIFLLKKYLRIYLKIYLKKNNNNNFIIEKKKKKKIYIYIYILDDIKINKKSIDMIL